MSDDTWKDDLALGLAGSTVERCGGDAEEAASILFAASMAALGEHMPYQTALRAAQMSLDELKRKHCEPHRLAAVE